MGHFKYHVFVCSNLRESGVTCCAASGAHDAHHFMKARVKELGLHGKGGVRVNHAGCLGRCASGPVIVVYPEEVWYRYESLEDVAEIVEQHLLNNKVVSRLIIPEKL